MTGSSEFGEPGVKQRFDAAKMIEKSGRAGGAQARSQGESKPGNRVALCGL